MATPIKSNALNGWDGTSRKGQAAYDQHFNFEMSIADAEDIISGLVEATDDEIEAAYAFIDKYR